MTVGAVARLHYRKAGEEDLERTYEIFLETSQDLNRRHGRSADLTSSVPRVRALAFRSNVLRLDPERFWVAESGGDLVGFGVATQRGRVWYLAALHVIPGFQSQGAGGELLRRCLAASAKGSIYTVVTDSINPVSNALYGKYGMFPQTALVTLEGPTSGPAGSSDLSLEKLKTGTGGPDRFEAADVAVLGYRRPEDHALWDRVSDLHGFVVRRSGPAGYLYVSESGVLGPVAVFRPEDLAPTLDLGIVVAGELGAPKARVQIPGICRAPIARLLACGFRFGVSIGLFLSSEPFGQLDCYIPSGEDALF